MCGGGGGGGGSSNAESIRLQRESLEASKAQAAQADVRWQQQFDYTKARHEEQKRIAEQKPPKSPESSADAAAPALDIAATNRRKRGREGYKNLVQSSTGLGITNP
tara:strand:- start:1377 stop:1694 length:318 start_codon:yes stop_codon:yes gene_type:complete